MIKKNNKNVRRQGSAFKNNLYKRSAEAVFKSRVLAESTFLLFLIKFLRRQNARKNFMCYKRK